MSQMFELSHLSLEIQECGETEDKQEVGCGLFCPGARAQGLVVDVYVPL